MNEITLEFSAEVHYLFCKLLKVNSSAKTRIAMAEMSPTSPSFWFFQSIRHFLPLLLHSLLLLMVHVLPLAAASFFPPQILSRALSHPQGHSCQHIQKLSKGKPLVSHGGLRFFGIYARGLLQFVNASNAKDTLFLISWSMYFWSFRSCQLEKYWGLIGRAQDRNR